MCLESRRGRTLSTEASRVRGIAPTGRAAHAGCVHDGPVGDGKEAVAVVGVVDTPVVVSAVVGALVGNARLGTPRVPVSGMKAQCKGGTRHTASLTPSESNKPISWIRFFAWHLVR